MLCFSLNVLWNRYGESNGLMILLDIWFLQSLVPLGSVEELLAAYDSQRRELPPPVVVWEWGWTKSAETWNGRAAMLAVLVLLVLEVTTGEGFLHQWGVLPFFHWSSCHPYLYLRPSLKEESFTTAWSPTHTNYCFLICGNLVVNSIQVSEWRLPLLLA